MKFGIINNKSTPGKEAAKLARVGIYSVYACHHGRNEDVYFEVQQDDIPGVCLEVWYDFDGALASAINLHTKRLAA